MKIEINYDGAAARCNVTAWDETSKTQKTKPLYQCSALTKAQVISAFENIKRNLKRAKDGPENNPYIKASAFNAGWDAASAVIINKAVKYLLDHKEEVQTEDNGIAGWIPDKFIMDFKQAME